MELLNQIPIAMKTNADRRNFLKKTTIAGLSLTLAPGIMLGRNALSRQSSVSTGFIEAVRRQTRPPIDTYNTAAWKALSPLSEQSIEHGSQTDTFPDFINRKWMTNKPLFGLTEKC